MIEKLNKINKAGNKFVDWIYDSKKRTLYFVVILLTIAVAISIVFRKQFDASINDNGEYDYITIPLAYLFSVPIVYLCTRIILKRKGGKSK